MKIELIKLLTAQASQYELQDSVWESLKPSDISHILGLMCVRGDGETLHHNSHAQAAVWLGEIMYLDNRNNLVKLSDHVGQYLVRRLRISRGAERVQGIVKHSINAYVDPKLCAHCDGVGRIPMSNAIGWDDCNPCGQSGRAGRPSNNQIADALGIERSRFHRTWAEAYEESEWKLERLHDTLVAAFARRLGWRTNQSIDAHQEQHWPYGKSAKTKAIDTIP